MFTPKILRRKTSTAISLINESITGDKPLPISDDKSSTDPKKPKQGLLGRHPTLGSMKPKMGQRVSLFDSSYQVVIIGLDNAGKSTSLYRLKMGHFVHTAPTVGFNCEKIKATDGKAKNTSFTIWDVGGQEKLRPLWRAYVRHTDAVIFVVDSTDPDRFEEARLELSNLLRTPDFPSQAPILLLANKQDLPTAQPEATVQNELGLHDLSPSQIFECRSCCAITGEGLDDIFDVLLELINKAKKLNKKKKDR